MPNKLAVYMHDTPSKGLFGADYRFLSHGCVRVQGVYDLCGMAAARNAAAGRTGVWDKAALEAKIKEGAPFDIKLAKAVPVIWVYLTGWSNGDGPAKFRNDVYGNRHGRRGAGERPSLARAMSERSAVVRLDRREFTNKGRDLLWRIRKAHALRRCGPLASESPDLHARAGRIGRGSKSAAAVGTYIAQDGVDASRAKGAFVGTYPRIRRVCREVLVAIFAVRSEFERHLSIPLRLAKSP